MHIFCFLYDYIIELKLLLHQVDNFTACCGLHMAVYAATSNVDEVIRRTGRLSNQTSRLRQLGADVGHNILELQRLIGEARAQAASVSITMMLYFNTVSMIWLFIWNGR